MKRGSLLALACGLVGLATGLLARPLTQGRTEISTEKVVNALRLLNTEEYSYRDANGRFAARDEMLTFLRKEGSLGRSPIDLENPSPYGLAITTTPDGTHYQISIQRPPDMKDKSTWCKTAAFSDDEGLIYLGKALDCEASAP